MAAQVASHLIPVLKSRESEFVNDSLKSDIKSLIDSISSDFINIDTFAGLVSRQNANDVSSSNKQSFLATFDRAFGVDVGEIFQKERIKTVVNNHVKENVRLIKSIPKQYFARVENVVLSGVKNGLTSGSIAKQLMTQGKDAKTKGSLGITLRRAKLIARDQTSKLNGQINSKRQQNLGITDYIWRSSQDDRVRELHRELDGQQFSWKDPSDRPPEGLDPGQPINCRCTAEGVVII